MARLKSLYQHPPGSFQFIQPETGQEKPFVGSFNAVVAQVVQLRQANRWLADKHAWRTDMAGVEFDVEQQNVARLIAGGFLTFVDDATGYTAPITDYPPAEKKTPWANAAGAVKRVSAGVAILMDWLGSGGKPVDYAVADRRAAVCATCPKNDGGDWKAYFTGPVAEKIRVQLEMKNDLKLRTLHDEKLTVCSGCDCPIQLKVHAPIEHIMAHTSEEVKARLDPRCWVLQEGTKTA